MPQSGMCAIKGGGSVYEHPRKNGRSAFSTFARCVVLFDFVLQFPGEVTPHPSRAGWQKRRPRSTLSPGRGLGSSYVGISEAIQKAELAMTPGPLPAERAVIRWGAATRAISGCGRTLRDCHPESIRYAPGENHVQSHNGKWLPAAENAETLSFRARTSGEEPCPASQTLRARSFAPKCGGSA